MRKVILLVVVAGVIVAGWFMYFNEAELASEVTVTQAELTDLNNTLEFSGEVASAQTYRVMSMTGGVVSTLFVSEGDKVSKGDALLSFDTTEIDAQIKQAELELALLQDTAAQTVMAGTDAQTLAQAALANEKAKIALALSQATGFDYDSLNDAFGADVQTQAEALEAMAVYSEETNLSEAYEALDTSQISETQIALAELAVQTLQTARTDMMVLSEISGTVVSLNVHQGEVLSPGVSAMVIADTDNTIINAYVYEKDVTALSEGMDVRILSESDVYNAILTSISKAATGVDATTQTGSMTKVEITPLEGFDRMPGASVDIEVVLSEQNGVLALPIDCFTADGYVYVVDETDTVEKRAVATGFEDPWDVEILSGVSEDELVVVFPDSLEEGQRVTYDPSE